MKLQIKEAMDSSIPTWLKSALSRLGKRVSAGRYNRGTRPSDFSQMVDIANTSYTRLPIPRTSQEFNTINKDPNHVTVIELEDEYGRQPIVWIPGYLNDEATVDWEHNWKARPLKATAAKKILPHVLEYGVLTIDPEGLKSVRSDRNGLPDDRRMHAQHLVTDPIRGTTKDGYGIWGRDEKKLQGPRKQHWELEKGYDKSGYRIQGLDKYKQMLAEMGVDQYNTVVDKALDSYEELASIVRLCRDDRSKREAHRRISDNILTTFDRIEDAYKDYLEQLEENPEYGGWSKRNVVEYMRQLREYAKKAKDFIAFIKSGSEYDQDAWKKFNW